TIRPPRIQGAPTPTPTRPPPAPDGPTRPPGRARRVARLLARRAAGPAPHAPDSPLAAESALVVIPCSGRKSTVGHAASGRSITEVLPAPLATDCRLPAGTDHRFATSMGPPRGP